MSKIDNTQHLANAMGEITHQSIEQKYCNVDLSESLVSFKIQSGPVSDSGRNGCDATDLIRYAIGLYRSFNSAHPCRENSISITKLEEALHWQEARTKDRTYRNVEGTNND
jgi:hypothetical protein